MWLYHSLLNHLSMESHLDCFYFGTITNKAAMNICVKKKNQQCAQQVQGKVRKAVWLKWNEQEEGRRAAREQIMQGFCLSCFISGCSGSELLREGFL